MSQPWDYIAKLVCIGDSGTGKSSVSASAELLLVTGRRAFADLLLYVTI